MKTISFYNKLISVANTAYIKSQQKCDKLAILAQECIDWSDNVSCDFMPGDGICIQIMLNDTSIYVESDTLIVPADKFFDNAIKNNGKLTQHQCEKISI